MKSFKKYVQNQAVVAIAVVLAALIATPVAQAATDRTSRVSKQRVKNWSQKQSQIRQRREMQTQRRVLKRTNPRYENARTKRVQGKDEDRQKTVIRPSRAMRLAEKQYGGKALSARLVGNMYRVKLIKNGRVRIVQIAASR